MFDCDGEAAVLRNWLQRAWCPQTSDDAPEAGGWESFLNDAGAGSTESDVVTVVQQRESTGSGGDEDARDRRGGWGAAEEFSAEFPAEFSALDTCSLAAAFPWGE
jgi:hypothetical protein